MSYKGGVAMLNFKYTNLSIKERLMGKGKLYKKNTDQQGNKVRMIYNVKVHDIPVPFDTAWRVVQQ